MKAALLKHLANCEGVVNNGEVVVPAWRVQTPNDGAFLILTRFDHDKPEQAERIMHLMRRFMVWRQATGFLLGMEVWLGAEKTRQGQEAIIAIGATRDGFAGGVMRRIRRQGGRAEFGALEWVAADQIDPVFFSVLPGRVEALAEGEAEELARIFGEGGELLARRS